MGIRNIGGGVCEAVHKVRRISRPLMTGQADGYVATGDTLEQRWTGPWAALEAKMLNLQADASNRLQATLTRQADGDHAELSAVWTSYVPGGGGGGGGGANAPGSSRENPSYALQVTSVQEPLLTHPLYANLSQEALTALKMLMDGYKLTEVVATASDGTPTTLEQALGQVDAKLVERVKKGQTHYMAPQIAVTARYRSDSLPDTGNAMKIGNPPGGFSTPAGCNWLQLVPGIEMQGNEIWVSETYLLSSPGGWDKDIYG